MNDFHIIGETGMIVFLVIQANNFLFFLPLQNFTGGLKGGKHITDCTNASRTMLMNIRTIQWDDQLCK